MPRRVTSPFALKESPIQSLPVVIDREDAIPILRGPIVALIDHQPAVGMAAAGFVGGVG